MAAPPQSQAVPDWFSQNAPAQTVAPPQPQAAPVAPGQTDWFSQNAPAAGQPVPQEATTQAAQDAYSFGPSLLEGFAKGAGQTVNTVSKLLNKIPVIGETLAPSTGIQAAGKLETPTGIGQKLGVGAEGLAEFLAGDEELKGLSMADRLKALGPVADAINKYPRLASALGMAVRQGTVGAVQGAAHGQSPVASGIGTGLAAGAGELAAQAAPGLAESALGVGSRLRGFGKTPGKAALELTNGFSPGAVEESAGASLDKLTNRLEQTYASAKNRVSLQPARNVLADAAKKALYQNDLGALNQVKDIEKQLTVDVGSGLPLSPSQRAVKVLALKRGIGNQIANWNPNIQDSRQLNLLKQVYGALDKSLDEAVPAGADLNQKISSLIDVKNRAGIMSRQAGGGQRTLHRIGAHTGALTSATGGAYAGYRAGGSEGALLGGAAGLIAPELIATPTAQMFAARMLPKVAPAAGPAVKVALSSLLPKH